MTTAMYNGNYVVGGEAGGAGPTPTPAPSENRLVAVDGFRPTRLYQRSGIGAGAATFSFFVVVQPDYFEYAGASGSPPNFRPIIGRSDLATSGWAFGRYDDGTSPLETVVYALALGQGDGPPAIVPVFACTPSDAFDRTYLLWVSYVGGTTYLVYVNGQLVTSDDLPFVASSDPFCLGDLSSATLLPADFLVSAAYAPIDASDLTLAASLWREFRRSGSLLDALTATFGAPQLSYEASDLVGLPPAGTTIVAPATWTNGGTLGAAGDLTWTGGATSLGTYSDPSPAFSGQPMAGSGAVSDVPPVNVTKSAASAGIAADASRQDHKHDISTAVPVSVGTANAEGTATTLARSDHVHAGTALTAAAPVNVTKAAAAVGTATDAARADHKHDISTAVVLSVGTANAEGTATTLARSDHVHDGTTELTAAAPVNVTRAAAVVGTATTAARADHKHDLSTAAPVNIGTANSAGVAATSVSSDHVHALDFTTWNAVAATASAPINVNNQNIVNVAELGVGTTAPTHGVTWAATTQSATYNTADQTTNYERVRMAWAANVLQFLSESGGTGTTRALQLSTGVPKLTCAASGCTAQGSGGTNASAQLGVSPGAAWTGTSAQQLGLSVTGTCNNSSTAGLDAIKVNITLTAAGSGGLMLFRGQTSGVDKWYVDSNGIEKLDSTITAAGTTGAQTINKPSGTVNFAAGASTLVVTNSLVNTSSLVTGAVRTNDATATLKNIVPAAGSFTITLTAAATAETSVGFRVLQM